MVLPLPGGYCCRCRVLPGGTAAPCCRVVGGCLQWGGVDGGDSPTIGVPLWWGAPLQWGWVDSGCFPTIGVAGLWVLVDSGCLPTIKDLSDVTLTFK